MLERVADGGMAAFPQILLGSYDESRRGVHTDDAGPCNIGHSNALTA